MKHTFTDSATFFTHIDGKTIPVVSTDICRMLEIRLNATQTAMNSAWDIIQSADWKGQKIEWRMMAKYWQEHTYVQNELPLQYVSPFPSRLIHPKPSSLPDALDYIAKLETALHQAGKYLTDAEKLENELVAKIIHIEKQLNEIHHPNRPFGAN
jgi:hypothetical protein